MSTLAILPALISMACHPKDEGWTDLHKGATNCMKVSFRADATAPAIAALLETATTAQSKSGQRVEALRPGIGSIVKTTASGRKAYDICFESDADKEQIDAVRRPFQESPLVSGLKGGQDEPNAPSS